MNKLKLGDRVELVEDYFGLKAGHQGLVVGDKNDNIPLILFDDYHYGHEGNGDENITTYLKGYSYERLRKINGGCLWVYEFRLKVLQPLNRGKCENNYE